MLIIYILSTNHNSSFTNLPLFYFSINSLIASTVNGPSNVTTLLSLLLYHLNNGISLIEESSISLS